MARSATASLTQRQRLGVLALCVGLVVLANWSVEGRPVPQFGASGLWFYSACLGLLLGDLVVEPWYTRPADAVVNATAIALASLTASREGLDISVDTFSVGRWSCLLLALAVLALGLAAMVTRRPRPERQTPLHRIAYVVATSLGRARVAFGLYFAVTAAAAYASSPEKLLVLYLLGGALLWTQSFRTMAERLVAIPVAGSAETDGVAVRDIGQPRTVFLDLPRGMNARVGQKLLRGGKQIGVVVDVSESDLAQRTAEAALYADANIERGEVLALDSALNADLDVIGSVARGTSLDRLNVVGNGTRLDQMHLTHGGLVRVDVRGQDVLYQVVDAEIESAQPEGSAVSKRVRVVARKLGVWSPQASTFVAVDWIPQPGAVVSRASAARSPTVDPRFVGRVPGTDYGATYDPVTGATHNTAILGILGIGKTTLAVELIWRTLAIGAKVIVVDITNEYAKHFAGVFGEEDQAELETALNAATQHRINATDYAGHEAAGNKAAFAAALCGELAKFFEGGDRMLIINPSRLTVTQDDGGFSGANNQAKRLVSLNPAEITAIIARKTLDQVSGVMSDRLRACLVLEEAHSLAPEWNSTANDGEKQAATATARALMQGRKFGFGSIIVTQRTANVTKSILNQCNTVFALRVYDQTGTEFLGNLMGGEYAGLLAELKDRQALLFGKASSCRSPLLIDLNDAELMQGWRAEIAAELTPSAPAETAQH
jgi:hypothetical protein